MRVKIVTLLLSVSFFGAVFVGGTVSVAAAQDLLPRDNGIFTYHKPPRWRESESHPLRTIAYLTHWVGWTAREAIYRPFSYFAASTPFTRSFLGYREPFDFRETVCFSSSGAIPDCRKVSPYTNIGGAGINLPSVVDTGDGMGTEAAVVAGGDRQVFFPDINFEFDRADLTDLGRGRVRQIAQLLGSVPSLVVVIEGHADYKGSDEYNMSLGERRAQAVVNELSGLGIDPARLSGISYGESKPIFTEEEDWARAVNRRVQFSVQGATEEMADAAGEEAEEIEG